MLISVCACTYKREHLKDTLESLDALTVPENAEIEIVIVDNDPNQFGKAIVEEFSAHSTLPVNYSFAGKRNISFARNQCIENANGEWVAFLDDDEVADSEWLVNLLQTATDHDADIAWGQVVSLYYPETPEWIIEGGFFERTIHETGKVLSTCAANSTLVKRSAINDQRFDLSYGLSGGEDSEFFNRLHLNGAKIVYCKEAKVSEYIEHNRLNIEFLKARKYRIGCTYTKYRTNDYSNLDTIKYFFDVLAKLIVTTISIPFFALKGKASYYKKLLQMYDKLGKLNYLFNKEVKDIY
ncbi:glycosyltransferase family 2 protein [Vibrio sp. WJH972]